MEYVPREGEDYIIDLYGVVGVGADAPVEDVHDALRDRVKEYHPDRLQGLAPEFQHKGERMMRLLNRARHILLDDERRGEYDQILTSWEGPISRDGTPTITSDRYHQMMMAHQDPEEIAQAMKSRDETVAAMTGYDPSRLEFLEGLIGSGGDKVDARLRKEYEAALLQYDRTLAIQEAGRGELLGLPDISGKQYRASLEYSQTVEHSLASAESNIRDEIRRQALGGVSARLALLAGETEQSSSSLASNMPSLTLPLYFEDQAQRIRELAKLRQEVVEKRLENFEPDYPEAELQTEFKPDVIVGVDEQLWMGFKLDADEGQADNVDLPDEIHALLQRSDYAAVIARGYNILTLEIREQLSPHDLINEALTKYLAKYNGG